MSQETELNTFMQSNFGLKPDSGAQVVNNRIAPERIPGMQDLNLGVVKEVTSKGFAVLDLANSAHFLYAAAVLGNGSIVKLGGKGWGGENKFTYATITPDSYYNISAEGRVSAGIRLAFMGQFAGNSLWLPRQYNPAHNVTIPGDVSTYLSGVNIQYSLEVHGQGVQVPAVESQHFLSFMAAISATKAGKVISGMLPGDERPHASHIIDEKGTGRGFIPLISAQGEGSNDIIQAPIGVTQVLNPKVAHAMGLVIALDASVLDVAALGMGRVIPKMADEQDAMVQFQNMGFMVVTKDTDTTLARYIEEGLV